MFKLGKGPEVAEAVATATAAVKQVLEKVKPVSVQKVFFHNSIVRPLFRIRVLWISHSNLDVTTVMAVCCLNGENQTALKLS